MQDNYQDRIIALLKERGENNASLAQGIGKGKATIGRYLSKSSNRTYPSLEELSDIARFLDVEPHWLCFGIGDKSTDKETINLLSDSEAATVNIYKRTDVQQQLTTGDATAIDTMPVAKEYADCFGVVYPVAGAVSRTWSCYALITKDKQWANDDIVLARIGNNPTPDFFTLVKIADKVHVWYGEDTERNPINTIDEGEIEVIGIVRWGVWARRG
ncbi:helix-turn-helix domain-containing protein [Vibrio europaeus]|uniref:Helix-turn-helix domain-containing protein n=1 Tax=Vibrio europaeus TaxID=300876 RepID=A0A178J840_9VIBR|nr:helix-turn-helix transcriptional regulator [Vibrio europaeus]MDC5705144.1 helix-turn-helix transcriptional regulator [Vibrio europaeus]MDC5710423.1 helix-turn-helix domain-containing protein [Vibrio europaeus]MDC5715513.1 helix-turn-helix domain-containing protein [Vibrio europaeus]MDC5719674.1 helix-turn-helix domain-containing protein [Vibrio europaeus]MDC5724438.1 helix-turn-helix domain-containing protein [Vibrio europaeus]